MQVVMAIDGSERQSNGNRRQYHAAIDGNRRQLSFAPCVSKISLFVGEFSVVFFDSTIEGGSVDMLHLQIAQVLVVPKGAPHSFGSAFSCRLDLRLNGFYAFLLKALLGQIGELGSGVGMAFRRNRRILLCGSDVFGLTCTEDGGDVCVTVDIDFTVVVVVIDHATDIIDSSSHSS